VTACFTPGGNCTDAIVKALGEAKRTVLVQAYSFTSAPIAKALLDAHTRGVQVQVILDKS
jgi:phosphatidylserine/phosphatidylglycerophosphate/cardiolipin synthase-like enzyme